jgi:anthranilate synthase component 2
MGVRLRHGVVEGVQFHPESIATPAGARLLANFVAAVAAHAGAPAGSAA